MWSNGRIFATQTKVGYEYWCKYYEEPSPFGIDGGKIFKLTICRLKDDKELYNYDRGLDFDILDEGGKAAYHIILTKYN